MWSASTSVFLPCGRRTGRRATRPPFLRSIQMRDAQRLLPLSRCEVPAPGSRPDAGALRLSAYQYSRVLPAFTVIWSFAPGASDAKRTANVPEADGFTMPSIRAKLFVVKPVPLVAVPES